MQFWAICIVCVYVGLGVFNWVTGLHWLAEFSLPLSVLGGVGLAIASNIPATPAAPTSTEAATDVSTTTTPEASAEAIEAPGISTAPATQPKAPSISFTIHKNRRP